MDLLRKKLCDGSLNDDNSSSDSISEDETTPYVRSLRTLSTASDTSSLRSLPKDRRSMTDDSELPPPNDGRDEIFVPKSSRLNMSQKKKSKFNETILATAAFTAATEPVDIQNEVRWFEGELPAKPYEGNDSKTLLRNTHNESDALHKRRPSNESISSTSTIDSLTFDFKITDGINTSGKSEPVMKKKLGHYRSKSDQFRRFRPFGTTKQLPNDAGKNGLKNDAEALSTSLPANSDVAG